MSWHVGIGLVPAAQGLGCVRTLHHPAIYRVFHLQCQFRLWPMYKYVHLNLSANMITQ